MTTFTKGAKLSSLKGIERQKRGELESSSGHGSSLNSTYETRQFIPHLVNEYSIESMIDLGCGDWNWMSKLRADIPNVNYEGWDASDVLIEEHIKNHQNDNTKFFCKDIINNPIPTVDMALCREVMFHLKKEYTMTILDNLRSAGVKYLLATSFNEVEGNDDQVRVMDHLGDWRFYYMNLNAEPFNLGDAMLEYVYEESSHDKTHKRFLCFYDLTKV